MSSARRLCPCPEEGGGVCVCAWGGYMDGKTVLKSAVRLRFQSLLRGSGGTLCSSLSQPAAVSEGAHSPVTAALGSYPPNQIHFY